MKRIIGQYIALAALVMGVVGIGVTDSVVALPADEPTPVFRYYKFKDGAHFFTNNESEKLSVAARPDVYKYEGIAYHSYPAQAAGTVAVHRFYNFKTGIHFYTANQAEATYVNDSLASLFRYEGIAYYGVSAEEAGTVKVHRFYNFKQGVHFFTSNQAEATNINDNSFNTFRYEGVSYHLPARSPAPAPNSLYLAPVAKTVASGANFSVAVRVNSGDQAVNTVQAGINYDATKLDFVSVSEGVAFPINAANNTSTAGTVLLARGTSAAPVTGDSRVVTVTFRLKATTGSTVVSFDTGTSQIVRASDSSNIVTGLFGTTITVQ